MLPVLQTNRCGSEQGLSLCPQIRGSCPRVQAESWGSGLPSSRCRHRWGRRPVSGRAQLEQASSARAPRGPRRPLLHQVPGCRPSSAFRPFPPNPPEQLTFLQMCVQAGGSSGPAREKPQLLPPLPCAKARRVFSSEMWSKDRQ